MQKGRKQFEVLKVSKPEESQQALQSIERMKKEQN